MRKYDNEYPAVWIADTTKSLRRYKMRKNFSIANILQFYIEWENGVLIPELISENEEVIYDTEGEVRKITSSNFKHNVINNPNEVVVYYYASWDDLSSYIFLDMLEQVIKFNYSKDKIANLDFFKIDMLLNELEDFEVDPYGNFPFIKIYGKKEGKDKPIDYLSQYKQFLPEEVKKFISQNTILVNRKK